MIIAECFFLSIFPPHETKVRFLQSFCFHFPRMIAAAARADVAEFLSIFIELENPLVTFRELRDPTGIISSYYLLALFSFF